LVGQSNFLSVTLVSVPTHRKRYTFFYNLMADNKKSFLLYCDLIHTVQKLSDDQAGKLFKHVLEYVNDLHPETEDLLTQVCFEPIKQSLKRDLKKWTKQHEQRIAAGKKSAEVRKRNATTVNDRSVSSTVSVSVSGSVSDKETYRCFAHLSMSVEQFKKLESDYTKEQIDFVLDSIENFKQNKKYKSLYLTAKNWLKKEQTKEEVQTLNKFKAPWD